MKRKMRNDSKERGTVNTTSLLSLYIHTCTESLTFRERSFFLQMGEEREKR